MGRKANVLQGGINRVGAMLPVHSDDDGNVPIDTVWTGVRRMLDQIGMYERRFERLAELIDNKYGRIRPATVDTIENGIRQLMSERDRARVAERQDVNQEGLRRLSDALGPHGKGYLDTLSFDDIEEAISSIRGLHQLALEDAQALVRQLEDAEAQVVSYRKSNHRWQRRLNAFTEVRDRIARAMEAEGFIGGVEDQVGKLIAAWSREKHRHQFGPPVPFGYNFHLPEPTLTAQQVRECGSVIDALRSAFVASPKFAEGGVVPPKSYSKGGLINPNGESE